VSLHELVELLRDTNRFTHVPYTRIYALINLRLLFGVSFSRSTNCLQFDMASGG
jgi:hypothetical protein